MSVRDPAVIVIAKAPLAGRVKTRCTPPCSPAQAAQLAEAALVDTLRAVDACSASRVVIALDGAPGSWLPTRFEVQPQCGGSLGDRLDHAFRSVAAPAFLIGMDTPQITVHMIDRALERLRSPSSPDALVGPSEDGGFWSLGLRDPAADLCHDVPMSRNDTCSMLLRGLRRRGLSHEMLAVLTDVDDFATALDVAGLAPNSRFAETIDRIAGEIGLGSARDVA
ncbi:MAG: cofC 1 [Ilumatobacteraceae bacterium]|nr:cofC 1 [Ilumatobacteraceae bacterium]